MSLEEGVELEIVAAECVGGYKLRLTFSDDHCSVVDFGPFLLAALNDETRQFVDSEKFRSYRLEWGNLVWGDYEMCFPIENLYLGQLEKASLLAVAEERATYGEE